MAPGAAYTDHQFRSNAHTGPRATPTIPKGGVFSVYAEITIPTPPQYPYEALLDIRTWREWNSFNPDVIIKAAQKIMSPYSITYRRLDWWTAYQIGQRVGTHFSAHERIFLVGDAVHTHRSVNSAVSFQFLIDAAQKPAKA